MQLASQNYYRFARGVGALVTLMGLLTVGAFVLFVLTGVNAVASELPELGHVGLLLMASIGGFALPLGASLFRSDPATSTRLRIAAGALGLMAIIRLVAFIHPELRATLGVAPLVEFFVLGGIALAAFGLRPEGEAAIEMHFEFGVDAPAAEVWRVLGEDFGNVAQWAASLRASSIDGDVSVGATRTCEVEAFGPFAPRTLTERLEVHDARGMRFTYSASSGLPSMIRAAKNRWSVEALGEVHSRARSHISIELAWWALPLAPLIAWRMRPGIEEVGEELAYRVERGQPHPRNRVR